MKDRIEDLLHRRTDLSTFVVHLTRDTSNSSGREAILSILQSHTVEAKNVYGMARGLAEKFPEVEETQRTVSFTETPLEHTWMMCRDIESRSIRFSGHGIAFTKSFARKKGVNPVWYLDITPGHDWLTPPINSLVEDVRTELARAESDAAELAQSSAILKLTPFIEQMGPMNSGGRKEFWWEREWRHVGDLGFHPFDIVVVFAPEGEHDELEDELKESETGYSGRMMPTFVDVKWGLERMISAMARVRDADLGPFPS